jgi:DNA polymerase-3 subunit epsilon
MSAVRAMWPRGPSRLPTPDKRTPWREAEFCVLDVETTGLDLARDDIVSYGAALVVGGRIPCGRVVYREVRPERPVSVGALTVHGLRTADLAGAPSIGDLLDELVDLLTGRILVAHAVWVERAFLDRALHPRRHRLGRAVVDTAALLRACRLVEPTKRVEPNLESAVRGLGLPVHSPHHALGDAFTTAQLFLALATRLERGRRLTVGNLCSISRHHATR